MLPTVGAGLLGASGRMGQLVTSLLATEYAARAHRVAAPKRGESFDALFAENVDVVIDFSLPEVSIDLIETALLRIGRLPAFVFGTTGWKTDQWKKAEELSRRTPVLQSSNFSTGVLAFREILRAAGPMLERLGYVPVLVESHHVHKKDAPSGTAKLIQGILSPGAPEKIQTHCIRAGEIIGDHEVTFHGPSDRISIGHFAQDRKIFARGAIDVALWLAEKKLPSGVIDINQYARERIQVSS